MIHFFSRKYGPLCLAFAGLLAPSGAWAQSIPASRKHPGPKPDASLELPAIVVRSSSQSTQRGPTFTLPASVSRVSGQRLDDENLTTTRDLVQRLPNLYLTSISPNSATIMIRGMGSMGDRSGNPPVPILLDGVPVSDSIGMQLFDLDGIDVLRGPQSLFGPNALGGMVMMTSRDPDQVRSGNVTLDYGTGGRARALASADTPLSDRTALRIAVGSEHANGYVDNFRLGRDDTAGWNNVFAHVKLLHRDDHGGKWRFSFYQLDSHGGSDMFAPSALARNHQSTSNDIGSSTTTNTLLTGGYERAFNGGTTLNVNLGASRSQHHYVFAPVGKMGRSVMDGITREFDLDARLHGQHGAVDWMVGLFDQLQKRDSPFLYEKGNTYRSRTFGGLLGNSAATYGQLGWRFAPAWRVVAGLRVEYDHLDFDWSGTINGRTQSLSGAKLDRTVALPRLTLEFEPSRRHFGWLTLARGYQAGGFNSAAATAAPASQPYGAAGANYIELGYRLRGRHHAWELGAVLFDTLMHDQNVELLGPTGRTIKTNAARSHSRGVELSGMWRPIRQLEFNAFAGFVDAKYDSYALGGIDYSGQPAAMTPRQSYGLRVSWRPNAQWDIGAGVVRQAGTTLLPSSAISNHPYALVDAHVYYHLRRWSVGVYGQNLGNAHYFLRGIGDLMAAGNPRTIGVRVSADF